MRNDVGIWIDHKKAVVVSLSGGPFKVDTIDSNAEGRHRWSARYHGANAGSPQESAREKTLEEKRRQHLLRYYRALIGKIRKSCHIYILGPGEAKLELEKEIRKSKELAPRIAAVETADKMPETQIVLKVKEFYRKLEERVSAPSGSKARRTVFAPVGATHSV